MDEKQPGHLNSLLIIVWETQIERSNLHLDCFSRSKLINTASQPTHLYRIPRRVTHMHQHIYCIQKYFMYMVLYINSHLCHTKWSNMYIFTQIKRLYRQKYQPIEAALNSTVWTVHTAHRTAPLVALWKSVLFSITYFFLIYLFIFFAVSVQTSQGQLLKKLWHLYDQSINVQILEFPLQGLITASVVWFFLSLTPLGGYIPPHLCNSLRILPLLKSKF